MKFRCLVLLLCAPLLNASKFEDFEYGSFPDGYDNFPRLNGKTPECEECFSASDNPPWEGFCNRAFKIKLPDKENSYQLRSKFLSIVKKCAYQKDLDSKLILRAEKITYDKEGMPNRVGVRYMEKVSSECLKKLFGLNMGIMNMGIIDSFSHIGSSLSYDVDSGEYRQDFRYVTSLIVKEN